MPLNGTKSSTNHDNLPKYIFTSPINGSRDGKPHLVWTVSLTLRSGDVANYRRALYSRSEQSEGGRITLQKIWMPLILGCTVCTAQKRDVEAEVNFLLLMLYFYYSIMLPSFQRISQGASQVDKQGCRSQFCSLHSDRILWFDPLKRLTPAASERCDLARWAKNMLCKVRNLKC